MSVKWDTLPKIWLLSDACMNHNVNYMYMIQVPTCGCVCTIVHHPRPILGLLHVHVNTVLNELLVITLGLCTVLTSHCSSARTTDTAQSCYEARATGNTVQVYNPVH